MNLTFNLLPNTAKIRHNLLNLLHVYIVYILAHPVKSVGVFYVSSLTVAVLLGTSRNFRVV
jgi:hypothetical protein